MSGGDGLAGRVVLVTGARRGIGRAVLDRFDALGAHVVGLDLEGGDAGDGPTIRQADVSDRTSIEHTVEAIEAEVGPISVLVNCAGVLRLGEALSLSDADWAQTFAVNLDGVRNVSETVARRMIPRRAGSIVTITSNAAQTPRMSMAAYCASKAASAMYCRVLGLELAEHGIRCNVVAPGSTMTDMQRQLWTDGNGLAATVAGSLDTYKLGIPLGRVAEAEDIADAVCFLASDRARHITLQQLVVDGGATLGCA